ncbi:MAG: DUF4430 domain-containing protein [Patescibacteria group bacterium]
MQRPKTKNINQKQKNYIKIFLIIFIILFTGFGCNKKKNITNVNELEQGQTNIEVVKTPTPSLEILENKKTIITPIPIPTVQVEQKETKSENTPKTEEQKINVELIINFNPRQISFPFSSVLNSSVYDLMQKAQKEGKINFRAKNYSFGVFIEEINSVKNSEKEKKYWMLYINDKLSEVGASAKKLKDRDRVMWKFEKQ